MQLFEELRRKRVVARIPGRVLCERVRISRGRLSEIERGHISPSPEKRAELERALNELIIARKRLAAAAAEVGWPVEAL